MSPQAEQAFRDERAAQSHLKAWLRWLEKLEKGRKGVAKGGLSHAALYDGAG